MISSNDFKRGTIIKVGGDIYTVLEFQHVKPGKGGAFVRTKLKSLTKGSIIDKTFRGGEKIEDVRIEKKEMQYLYDEGDALVLMDNETYEQETIDKELFKDVIHYIKEGDVVYISLYEDKPITIEPSTFVMLKVVFAEPSEKSDTVTSVTKRVKVETGAEIQVPLFVDEGDIIKIDTRKGEYVERIKQ